MMTLDPAAQPARRALVVDDDRNLRCLSRATLESAGFTVSEAVDGSQALDSIDHESPDVVLLDVMMPGLSGFDVCSRIRECSALENLPIIMMTGLEDIASISRAYEVGATDFVTKPVNWELLKHRVRYAIRASGAIAGLANAQRIARLGSWEWSPYSGRLTCSEEARRILDIPRTADEPALDEIDERIYPADRDRIRRERGIALQCGGSYELDYRLMTAAGDELRFVREQGEVVASEGRALRMTGTVLDTTERRRFESKITHMALHDPLTDLPNRRLFMQSLDKAMRASDHTGRRIALLYFDLDRFKLINDTYGHGTGDEVLRSLSKHLRERLRDTDVIGRLASPAESMLSRLGGDEFAVLLYEIDDRERAAQVAGRLQDCLREVRVRDVHVSLTASIGVAVYPDDASSVQALMTSVDVAMYEAKRAGRDTLRFFTSELDERLRERVAVERELARALEHNELFLRYQPIYDLQGGTMTGVEALLRWENPVLGTVPPDRFIPIAEEMGLILPWGDWVLRTACRDAHGWIDAGLEDLLLSVNVSVHQFRQRDFIGKLEEILADAGLAPRHLCLELTESVLMDDVDGSAQTLTRLQQLGITVSIDDFGTGYSSLSYLRRLRPDRLKIDRSFVTEIPEAEESMRLTSAIVAMAQSLGIAVIAEGVEDPRQLSFLLEHRCEMAQGYLLARPSRTEEIVGLARQNDVADIIRHLSEGRAA